MCPRCVPPPLHAPLPAGTSVGAEAVFLVLVVVGGGGTPGQPILAPLRGAPGVGAALEDEGEVAFGSVGIPVAGLHHCSKRGGSVLGLGLAPSDPPESTTLCPYLSRFPVSRTHHRQSGHHPGCPGLGERRGPGGRPCHRRGTRPHALQEKAPSVGPVRGALTSPACTWMPKPCTPPALVGAGGPWARPKETWGEDPTGRVRHQPPPHSLPDHRTSP